MLTIKFVDNCGLQLFIQTWHIDGVYSNITNEQFLHIGIHKYMQLCIYNYTYNYYKEFCMDGQRQSATKLPVCVTMI